MNVITNNKRVPAIMLLIINFRRNEKKVFLFALVCFSKRRSVPFFFSSYITYLDK